MLKYAKIIDNHTKECEVGLGQNISFYKSIGMTKKDVEQAYNGNWYILGYAPPPTKEVQKELRAEAYRQEVDPITAHISRLKDEEQTPEIQEEIATLQAERETKVNDIKQRYPYPTEE